MSKQINLETDRAYLRNLITKDAEDFYNLNLDNEVLKYTGDIPFKSITDAENFLTTYDQYEKYGVRRLAIIDKKTTKFMGWCGLKYTPDLNEYDIGFRLFKSYWDQGFATETARKCLEYGFNSLELNVIIGRTMVDNKASIKVLEKIGMLFKKTFDFDGQKGLIYESTKYDYEKES